MTSKFATCARFVCAAILMFWMPSAALAQEATGAPPANVRMRIGPIYLNPTIALSNAGVDSNVYNDPNSAQPVSDYTVTVSPKTDIWVRLGPTWFNTGITEDIVYYQKQASQRSANNSYVLSWTIPFNFLTFIPKGSYQSTRERPGFEVDTRAPRAEVEYGGEIDVKALSKTAIAVTIDRHQTVFQEGAEYLNVSLHDELNRTVLAESVSLRHQATPLTTLSLEVGLSQERYAYQTLRNSDARTITGALRFDPAALIKGSASFGYEDYKPFDPGTPGYSGTTAAVNLSYVFVSITKVGAQLQRQIQQSYDINTPYYVQSGGGLDIGQQLFGPLDIVARGGYQWLAYRSRVGALVSFPDRVDTVRTYGAGLGYHLGKDTRIGFNVDQSDRRSLEASHTYSDLKYGFTVTYGGS